MGCTSTAYKDIFLADANSRFRFQIVCCIFIVLLYITHRFMFHFRNIKRVFTIHSLDVTVLIIARSVQSWICSLDISPGIVF